jgi:hypothetical protein
MRKPIGLKKLKKRLIAFSQTIYSILPSKGIARPVFIIGCGRSGTTILGRALSKHKDITYLNEPTHLWFSVYPETDIWSSKALSRKGKLVFQAADAKDRKNRKLRRLFCFETIKMRKPVLVEKWPINNFRLNFVYKIFPDARFIHIFRNGLEVARSIEERSIKGRWFGIDSYKWDRLAEYALSRDDTAYLPGLCSTYFDKGLLEWRLSTEAAVEFLSHMPKNTFLELSYDELIQRPIETILQVFLFIGVEDDSNVKSFVADNIARKKRKLEPETLSEKERTIGGKLLPLSMDGLKGLTRRFA